MLRQGLCLVVVMLCPVVLGFNPRDNFDEQLDQYIEQVSITKEQLDANPGIVQAVEDTLNKRWPGNKVTIFGSVLSGLAFQSSDIDLKVTLANKTYVSENDVIDEATVLFENDPRYKNVAVTKNSMVPTIHFFYIPAQRQCDVSFKDHTGVFDTKLVRYMLTRNERLKKLAIVIKQWGKIQNVTGKKYMPTIGLVFLFVFFLQRMNILPTVRQLQEGVEPIIINHYGFWNVAFDEREYATDNNYDTYRLLGEFYQFYYNFDFDKYIISPYVGNAIERSAFQNLNSVPDEFGMYKENVKNEFSLKLNCTAICIQANFVHCDIFSKRVDIKIRDSTKTKFRAAANLYEGRNISNFLTELLTPIND